jgi:hypothetical protein
MSQKRDLGTAILNIKIAFETLNKEAIKKQLDLAMGIVDKSIQQATKAIKPKKSASKATETIGKELVGGIEKGIEQSAPKIKAKARSVFRWFMGTLEKDAEIKSPSRKTMRLAEQLAAGIIQGLKGSKRDIEKAALDTSTAATPKIVRKYLDQITNLKDELAGLAATWFDTKTAMSQGIASESDLLKIAKAITNANKALELLQKKAQSQPGLQIEESPKDRVRDLEKESQLRQKSRADLQKSAGGVKKLSQDLRELVSVYELAEQGAKQLGAVTQGAFQKAEKTFSSVVASAKKLRNFDEAEKALISMKMSLTSSARSIENEKARKAALEGVTQAYEKQMAAIAELRRIEQARQQSVKDKAQVDLQKAAGGTARLSQELKELVTIYETAAQGAKKLGTLSQAALEKAGKTFSNVLNTAKKFKNFVCRYCLALRV